MKAVTETTHTRSVVDDVFDAFRAHDLDAFREVLADDAVLRDPSSGQEHKGPDAIIDAVSVVLTAIPDLQVDVETVIASGEHAAAEVVRTGTHDGEMQLPSGTVPPTGREVRLPESIFFRVRDGKLVHMTTYVDRMHVMNAFGLMEEDGS
jgi:steroid delta-isomerase-like uncharacterized protein